MSKICFCNLRTQKTQYTNMRRIFFTVLLGTLYISSVNAQELKMPAPSPTAVLKQDFSTSNIEINYSRPSMRGRKIFGGIVPFGEVWRTGANGATKITFGEDVTLNGKAIKAGTYALYTIPSEKEWKVIINTGISNWGVSGFNEKDDVATFSVPVIKTSETVQSFTISIDNITINSAEISLAWENTKAVIKVAADNDKRISDYLETAINNPKKPYQQAANYYLETGRNLDKAAEYADKAIAENPQAFWLYWLKARIYQKQNKKSDALNAANKSAELAAATPYAAEYKRNAEKLAQEMK